ncbi:MDR family MFS transporter [Xylophilus sp.]|uniref:MDR family MFS transporter n=1 Tax=Xylophilus sp. TaxID=2653893 RepID=UPI0013BDC57A|nr:MDR family MFS transporter [Xylophilus sp.]KAF1047284.1 MAG: Multidrug resistance protein 3 [Xylophilus sp.]
MVLRIAVAGLMLAMVLSALDQNIVAAALPRMASDLGGLAHLPWVATAFMVASTVSTPLYGRLSDIHGRRPLFVVSIGIFLAASALCGLARSMPELIVFRALQGLGAGGLMTLSQTTIGDLVGPRERARWQGLFTGAFAVCSVVGPALGGLLTQALSWRWVFYVNLPVGAVALALLLVALGRAPRAAARSGRRIDTAGAALLAAATLLWLAARLLGGHGIAWASWRMAGLAAGALVLLAAFVAVERRVAEPLMDLSLFGVPAFRAGVLATAAMAFAMMGALVFLPLYLQLVLGRQPAEAGLLMLPQVAGMVVSAAVGGRLVARTGRFQRALRIGVALEGAGLALLAVCAFAGAPAAAFGAALVLLGLGMGVGMPNATVIVQNAVPRGQLGAATATMSFLRSLGGVAGVAVSGAVMGGVLQWRWPGGTLGASAAAWSEGGLSALAGLAPAAQHGVLDAYRLAIGASFAVGGLVMLLAQLPVRRLPDEVVERG